MQVKPPKKSENTSNLYTNLYICTLFVMSYNIKHTIMEEITSFVLIVIIVFGILQIILFFKLWGMTNNVKKIRESFLTGADGLSPAKIEFAIGNIEKAKLLLQELQENRVLQEVLYENGQKTAQERKWENIENNILSMYRVN